MRKPWRFVGIVVGMVLNVLIAGIWFWFAREDLALAGVVPEVAGRACLKAMMSGVFASNAGFVVSRWFFPKTKES